MFIRPDYHKDVNTRIEFMFVNRLSGKYQLMLVNESVECNHKYQRAFTITGP